MCHKAHPLYAPYDMGGLHEMSQQTRTTLRHSQNPAVHPICNDIDSNMRLPEQTRLQPRLHHVEWASNDGSGHATNPVKNARRGVRIQTPSTSESKTHAPPTKCCQDFAGTHFDCAVSDIGNLTVTVAREGGRFVGHVIRDLISDDRLVPWAAKRYARGPAALRSCGPRSLRAHNTAPPMDYLV